VEERDGNSSAEKAASAEKAVIEQSCSRFWSTPFDCFQYSLFRWASPPKAINHAILMEKNIHFLIAFAGTGLNLD
jgi:hypothetical protein